MTADLARPGEAVRVGADWLALREPADARARSTALVDVVRAHLRTERRAIIHDLGCGTGSMGRWLAPLLPGPQHWILCDRDPDLLALAAAGLPGAAADGAAVTGRVRQRDITRLDSMELADASLITASALLDMLTAEELDRFVTACAGARCPVLVTLSVIGRVELSPPDPLDASIEAAFNAHQRRTFAGRRLLGPDAVTVAIEAFTCFGADVVVLPSPWHLGPDQAELAAQWFAGWLGAACEQVPALVPATVAYAERRRAEAAAGRLGVTVHHRDLLAVPQ